MSVFNCFPESNGMPYQRKTSYDNKCVSTVSGGNLSRNIGVVKGQKKIKIDFKTPPSFAL
jgi:hypothetical protein